MNRRDFLQKTTTAGVALSAFPFIHVAPKQKKYTCALIGSGWWGMNILSEAVASGTVKVVALCDVDENQSKKAQADLAKITADSPKIYRDFRECLQREKPEIAIVATPDHWHPLIAIEAVKQGAHVYVEKPIGHTILEGRAMVKAARDTGKVMQVGLHRHISPHNREGIKFLQSGKAGKIGMVRSFVHYPFNPNAQPTKPTDPPAGLDWDFWCGPAPLVPYTPAIHPKGFRQYLHFANGQAGDWGVHWFDQILWWTEEKYPKSVFSTASKNIRKDGADAPDTQTITFEFESFTATWEHRLYAGNESEKHGIGVYFYGTEGIFHMGWRDGWTFYPSNRNREVIHMEPILHSPDYHNIPELWADFIQAIERNRLPVADIEAGHRASNMSLLGMLSHNLGRSVRWDGTKDECPNDPEANALLKRDYRAPWVYPS